MYVCVCAAVTKTELIAAIESNNSLEDVLDDLGAGSACCTCLPEIKDIYNATIDTVDK